MQWNESVKNLSPSAVTVRRRVAEYLEQNPSATVLYLNQARMNMSLPPKVISGMKEAVNEVASPHGMRLDCPWDGYASLKTAIAARYQKIGVDVSESDIFITSGLETAHSSLSLLFGAENNAVTTDPGNHIIWEIQRMAGRNLRFLKATVENAFKPLPDEREADLIFLSSPHSVTGAAYTREELQKWVNYANEKGSVLFFDASLSEYLTDEVTPKSIYELPGAKDCAVELFSFENGYGVQELKVAYVVIPPALEREGEHLQQLFLNSQPAAITPPSFVMQKAAELLLSEEVRTETEQILQRLKKVADLLSEELGKAGIAHVGEDTSPYIWAQCPAGLSSWQCFDLFLEKAGVVVSPGSRFGSGGEGFFRITSFGHPEEVKEAAERIRLALQSTAEKEAPEEIPQPAIDIFAPTEEEPLPGEPLQENTLPEPPEENA